MKKWISQRWPFVFAGMFVIGAVGWWFFIRATPERVARQALAALEAKDTQALCRLADPEEMKILHLTPTIVDKILRETLWSTEFNQTHHHLTDEWVSVHPDVKGFGIYPRHISVQPPNPPHPKNFWLISIQNPDGSWHINLCHILSTSCFSKTGGMDASKLYYQYATQYGINGSRSQNGPYRSMADLRKGLRVVFPKEASNWFP